MTNRRQPTLADLMARMVCTCTPSPGFPAAVPGKGGHAAMPGGGMRCAAATAAAEVARRYYEQELDRRDRRIEAMRRMVGGCPNDTNGDGDCGGPCCPFCGGFRYRATPLPIDESKYLAALALLPEDDRLKCTEGDWEVQS